MSQEIVSGQHGRNKILTKGIKMLMKICSITSHPIVAYPEEICPLCKAVKEIKNLKKRIKVLLKENDNLTNSERRENIYNNYV